MLDRSRHRALKEGFRAPICFEDANVLDEAPLGLVQIEPGERSTSGREMRRGVIEKAELFDGAP